MAGHQQLANLGVGTGLGKGHLFRGDLLRRYVSDQQSSTLWRREERAAEVKTWLDQLSAVEASEASLEAMFIQRILCGVLGYAAHPSAEATLYPKPPSRLTAIKGTPDIALGWFGGDSPRFTAVLELKKPGTDLDAPQAGYGGKTPVEQAFEYGSRILAVRWVLVSDMRVIRLYSVHSDGEYEEFDLRVCVDPDGRPTGEYARLHLLLHSRYLVEGHERAPVALLYSKSADRQLAIRDGFYNAYYEVRADLYDAIRTASAALDPTPTKDELLEATQRLLDRLLFMFYCEHHPQGLIQRDTVRKVVDAARSRPGRDACRIYADLKELFREVDTGSPAESGLSIDGYNGELFKWHRILDQISLPDSLAGKPYAAVERGGGQRNIRGVWGLDVYDFWIELTEHLLGHIFEQSLSDLCELGQSQAKSLDERLNERKRSGVFYTTSVLSDFLCDSALRSVLDERAPAVGPDGDDGALLARREAALRELRVVDLACGSGAFLVSSFVAMMRELGRIQGVQARQQQTGGHLLMFEERPDLTALLRDCLYGVDKLPQAVELAKLSLWLRSAQKGEKVPDLSGHIVAGDSLDLPCVEAQIGATEAAFDLVVGNPPWGGELDPDAYAAAVEALGVEASPIWDSWELFVLLALRALRPGGRLALVLPDSLLYPEKGRLRRLLCQQAELEKVYRLGPGWFGSNVRMDTVVIQARRAVPDPQARMAAMVVGGDLRRSAIRGEVPLSQIEARTSRLLPLARTLASESHELELFRTERDDIVMRAMQARSVGLASLCTRARGEEMSKSGLLWECPSCLTLTTPGVKKKGGGYRDKPCERCGRLLTESQVQATCLVDSGPARPDGAVPFIDGDDICARYKAVAPTKWLRLDPARWIAKDENLYASPKILLRQAGVGISATLDPTGARCPQSVYIYRLTPDLVSAGYTHEFVLAALLSRTMFYHVMKRFAEVDPDKAFAKLTHERLAELPVPTVDFADRHQRAAHDEIVSAVRALLAGSASLGGPEDLAIEQALRGLWGLSADDGAYINGEFYGLPDSQQVRDLFPNGRPLPTVGDVPHGW